MVRNKFQELFLQAALFKSNCLSLKDPGTKEAQWQQGQAVSLANVERKLTKSIAKGDIMCFLSLNHSATERHSDMEVVVLKQYQKYIMISTVFGQFSQS